MFFFLIPKSNTRVMCYDSIALRGNYAIRHFFLVPAAAAFLTPWEPLKIYRKTGGFFSSTLAGQRTVLIIRRDILFPLQLAALRHCTSHDTHTPRLYTILYWTHHSCRSYYDGVATDRYYTTPPAIDRGYAGPEFYEWSLHDFLFMNRARRTQL